MNQILPTDLYLLSDRDLNSIPATLNLSSPRTVFPSHHPHSSASQPLYERCPPSSTSSYFFFFNEKGVWGNSMKSRDAMLGNLSSGESMLICREMWWLGSCQKTCRCPVPLNPLTHPRLVTGSFLAQCSPLSSPASSTRPVVARHLHTFPTRHVAGVSPRTSSIARRLL